MKRLLVATGLWLCSMLVVWASTHMSLNVGLWLFGSVAVVGSWLFFFWLVGVK